MNFDELASSMPPLSSFEWKQEYNVDLDEASFDTQAFLDSFEYDVHEYLTLDVSEDMLNHVCDPFDMLISMTTPNCDECFKASKPALAKILSLGSSLKDMVFPLQKDMHKVFPKELCLTRIPDRWVEDDFMRRLDHDVFSALHAIVIGSNTHFLNIKFIIKRSYDSALHHLHDVFFPSMYADLNAAGLTKDEQRIAYNVAMYRIVALRISFKKLHCVFKHYKNIFMMNRKGVRHSTSVALNLTHLEAREFCLMPLTINYSNADVYFKNNSFFALFHTF